MVRPIEEQIIVVVGASSGIGRETALTLARNGAKVVVAARGEEPLDELVEQIRSEGGEATAIPTDVSIFEEVENLARQAKEKYGRIDTWVNNAGILVVGDFDKTDLDEARRVFDVNFWGEYHGMKAVLPIMREQDSGTIINVTSATTKRPLPLMSVYSASKCAINGLSEAVQAELAGTNINLCMVLPATIDTPLYQHARSKEGHLPRPAPPIYPPSEVARAILMTAKHPKRLVYAGPAAQLFSITNTIAPGLANRVLGKVTRPVLLDPRPEGPSGHDNLYEPMHTKPATSDGGWRGRRYMTGEIAGRAAMGVAALFVIRKLVKR